MPTVIHVAVTAGTSHHARSGVKPRIARAIEPSNDAPTIPMLSVSVSRVGSSCAAALLAHSSGSSRYASPISGSCSNSARDAFAVPFASACARSHSQAPIAAPATAAATCQGDASCAISNSCAVSSTSARVAAESMMANRCCPTRPTRARLVRNPYGTNMAHIAMVLRGEKPSVIRSWSGIANSNGRRSNAAIRTTR